MAFAAQRQSILRRPVRPAAALSNRENSEREYQAELYRLHRKQETIHQVETNTLAKLGMLRTTGGAREQIEEKKRDIALLEDRRRREQQAQHNSEHTFMPSTDPQAVVAQRRRDQAKAIRDENYRLMVERDEKKRTLDHLNKVEEANMIQNGGFVDKFGSSLR
mmetsp:Transcript_32415/g.70054  ORF Transcript_32415/g.70054 Transcript_32415/m.70054 type:complete len:163 (-) Transcript_32415:51-539(-)